MIISKNCRSSVLVLVFCVAFTHAISGQITKDYLQFSQIGQFGSARMQSMANAFHSLGGGVTALHLNPAGSAVNINSKMSLGLSFNNNENLSNYNRLELKSSDDYFGFSHAGGLLIAEQIDQSNPWRKISFGFSTATLKNFDQSIFASGITDIGLSNYFSRQAQGTALSDLQLGSNETIGSAYTYLGNTQGRGAQLGLLGYQAYIIDPQNENGANTNYIVTSDDQRRQNVYMELGGVIRQFSLSMSNLITFHRVPSGNTCELFYLDSQGASQCLAHCLLLL